MEILDYVNFNAEGTQWGPERFTVFEREYFYLDPGHPRQVPHEIQCLALRASHPREGPDHDKTLHQRTAQLATLTGDLDEANEFRNSAHAPSRVE